MNADFAPVIPAITPIHGCSARVWLFGTGQEIRDLPGAARHRPVRASWLKASPKRRLEQDVREELAAHIDFI